MNGSYCTIVINTRSTKRELNQDHYRMYTGICMQRENIYPSIHTCTGKVSIIWLLCDLVIMCYKPVLFSLCVQYSSFLLSGMQSARNDGSGRDDASGSSEPGT